MDTTTSSTKPLVTSTPIKHNIPEPSTSGKGKSIPGKVVPKKTSVKVSQPRVEIPTVVTQRPRIQPVLRLRPTLGTTLGAADNYQDIFQSHLGTAAAQPDNPLTQYLHEKIYAKSKAKYVNEIKVKLRQYDAELLKLAELPRKEALARKKEIENYILNEYGNMYNFREILEEVFRQSSHDFDELNKQIERNTWLKDMDIIINRIYLSKTYEEYDKQVEILHEHLRKLNQIQLSEDEHRYVQSTLQLMDRSSILHNVFDSGAIKGKRTIKIILFDFCSLQCM